MDIRHEDGHLALSGSLTLETVDRLLNESEAWLRGAVDGEIVVDLADVTDVDSAAVALLLEWQRAAARRGGHLAIRSAPERLRAIARISGLDALLNFERTDDTVSEKA